MTPVSQGAASDGRGNQADRQDQGQRDVPVEVVENHVATTPVGIDQAAGVPRAPVPPKTTPAYWRPTLNATATT
jgi:hypothetical protein